VQAPVDDRSDDEALVYREAAIHHAAADLRADCRLIHLRIPSPSLFARARIDRKHHAPVGDAEYRSVPHQRRRFLPAASRADVVRPGEPESLHVRRVDLGERTVARLGLIEAVGQPLPRLRGASQRRVVDAR
jgi:hypothetical protein